ncbi:MAG: IS200/IS605 family transposase [Bacteroidota bacterium]|nr:IS200/IS605 family transposase [Bacteroidota bacterium]
MSSYRQILYHIIFRTKNSRKTLPLHSRDKLFAYIMGIIKNKNCHLYRINGMKDHIHILSDLHPGIALADFMRDIKTSTSVWLKQQDEFQLFDGWADGYAALTYSYREKETLINYIKNQQNHHKKVSFIEELRTLLESQGIQIDDRYFP